APARAHHESPQTQSIRATPLTCSTWPPTRRAHPRLRCRAPFPRAPDRQKPASLLRLESFDPRCASNRDQCSLFLTAADSTRPLPPSLCVDCRPHSDSDDLRQPRWCILSPAPPRHDDRREIRLTKSRWYHLYKRWLCRRSFRPVRGKRHRSCALHPWANPSPNPHRRSSCRDKPPTPVAQSCRAIGNSSWLSSEGHVIVEIKHIGPGFDVFTRFTRLSDHVRE